MVECSRPNGSAKCLGMKPRLCMSRANRFSSGGIRAVGGIARHPRKPLAPDATTNRCLPGQAPQDDSWHLAAGKAEKGKGSTV